MTICRKRVYEQPAPEDGTRVLVERLWPRGLSKEHTAVDHWLREVAPSPELRRWFRHDRAKWDEFRRRYLEELRARPQQLERLRRLARSGPLASVFAARETERDSAALLRDAVEEERQAAA